MSGAQLLQAVAGTVYMATITTVGLRLIFLARRNRTWPELMLGISLFVGGTIAATVEAAGMSGHVYFTPEVSGTLLAIGKALGIAGFILQALFVRMVFRPDDRWALGLVFAIAMLLTGTFAAFYLAGSFSTGQMPLPIFLSELTARCTGSFWLIFESLRYYGFMRKRLGLGLADPVVADRFRLFAIAAIAGLCLLATSVPPMIWPAADSRWLDLLIPFFAASGVTASVAFLLAFFPPAWYRARIERQHADTAPAH